MNHTCLYSPATEHHRTLPGTHFPSSWGWEAELACVAWWNAEVVCSPYCLWWPGIELETMKLWPLSCESSAVTTRLSTEPLLCCVMVMRSGYCHQRGGITGLNWCQKWMRFSGWFSLVGDIAVSSLRCFNIVGWVAWRGLLEPAWNVLFWWPSNSEKKKAVEPKTVYVYACVHVCCQTSCLQCFNTVCWSWGSTPGL